MFQFFPKNTHKTGAQVEDCFSFPIWPNLNTLINKKVSHCKKPTIHCLVFAKRFCWVKGKIVEDVLIRFWNQNYCSIYMKRLPFVFVALRCPTVPRKECKLRKNAGGSHTKLLHSGRSSGKSVASLIGKSTIQTTFVCSKHCYKQK